MTTATYPGPVRSEPLAIELHNTLFCVEGRRVDGIDGERGMRAWIAAIRDRLPVDARGADPGRLADLLRLREAVREVLRAAVERRSPRPAAVRTVNDAGRRAPRSPRLVPRRGGGLDATLDFGDADATDVLLATIAADAVDLVTGGHREELILCEAPRCVLMFLRDHPRRAWCSPACGNRARQARHYRRTHSQLAGR